MLEVKINLGFRKNIVHTFEGAVRALEIAEKVKEEFQGIESEDFYIVYNGRLARDADLCENGTAEIVPRIFGGKGGFGSMLRAIGAQIEKTTNREACRDLSGRRLRDINEEKRLKSWIDKQATREEEAVERKKKKLERLCAQPKHEFKDKNYEMERSTLTEKVGDAVEEGFKLAMTAESSGIKRKINDKGKTPRKILALDLDIDSDELGSSSDESDEDSCGAGKNYSSSSKKESDDSKNGGSSDSNENQFSPKDSDESLNAPSNSSETETNPNLIADVKHVDKTALAL